MGKLVRDNIPEMIRASGRVPSVKTLGIDAFKTALRDKLIEETSELRAAEDRSKILTEAADVLEVLTAFAAYHGFSLNEVAKEGQWPTNRARRLHEEMVVE